MGEEQGETGERGGGGGGVSGVSYLLVWFMSQPLLTNSALTDKILPFQSCLFQANVALALQRQWRDLTYLQGSQTQYTQGPLKVESG